MNPLTFTLNQKLEQRIDLSPLTPDQLHGKTIEEIRLIHLEFGKLRIPTGQIFDITGNDSNDIVFSNCSSKSDFIGKNMQSGRISVYGDVGACLGFQMKNGEIFVHGNAGTFAASGMSAGLISINGNAGDFLGAAYFGDRKGMKGGTVIVSGNAGDRVGDQMRRGVILIEGDAGNYCASRMLAGTIGVLGNVGEHIGFSMRRGTVLLFKPPKLHPTINDCGSITLPFLKLLFKSFEPLPTKFAKIKKDRVRKYAGDIANDGKGEILLFND